MEVGYNIKSVVNIYVKADVDNQSPVKPPLRKNMRNDIIKYRLTSTLSTPFNNVSVQLTILTTAGKEIITVIVL